MLTKRIIPCLDVKDGRVVKGVHFLNLRDAGDPVELGARYSNEGADELPLIARTYHSLSDSPTRRLAKPVANRFFTSVFLIFEIWSGPKKDSTVENNATASTPTSSASGERFLKPAPAN